MNKVKLCIAIVMITATVLPRAGIITNRVILSGGYYS